VLYPISKTKRKFSRYYIDIILMKFSKLNKTNQLINTLKSMNIDEKDFLDSGCTATVFLKNNQAVKVCRKTIRYFSNYNGNAIAFKNHINTMGDIFLPVKDILYEDSQFFIYTQDICKPLNKKDIDKKITIEFLHLFKAMIKKNCIVSGLSPGNLCHYQGKLLIYDYHGLHILKNWKSSRIPRNLVKYMTLVFCPQKYHDHKVIMANFDKKAIKQLTHLPETFIALLNAMLDDKKSPDYIIAYIDQCIQQVDH